MGLYVLQSEVGKHDVDNGIIYEPSDEASAPVGENDCP